MKDIHFYMLAGGDSKRFKEIDPTIDKALIKNPKWGNIPLFIRTIKSIKEMIPNLTIIVNDEERKRKYEQFLKEYNLKNVDFLIDDPNLLVKGPLNSLITAFRNADASYCHFIPCDMPFINPKLIEHLYTKRERGNIISYIFPNGKLEPLFSLYQTDYMLKIFNYINLFEKKRPSALFRGSDRLHVVSIKEIINIDPDLKSFININELKSIEINSILVPSNLNNFNSFDIVNKTFKTSNFQELIDQFNRIVNLLEDEGSKHLFSETNFSYFWIASYYDYLGTIIFRRKPDKQKRFLELAMYLYTQEIEHYQASDIKFLKRHANQDLQRCKDHLRIINEYLQ